MFTSYSKKTVRYVVIKIMEIERINSFDFKRFLTPKQYKFISNRSLTKVWGSCRRVGKTVLIVFHIIWTDLKVAPDVRGDICYTSTTKDKATQLIFYPLTAILGILGRLSKKPSRSDGVIYTKSSDIILMGLRDFRDAERVRGFKLKGLFIDECQSIRSDILEYTVNTAAFMALADFITDGAQCILAGTPPASLGHFFAKFKREKADFTMDSQLEDNTALGAESIRRIKEGLRKQLGIPLDLPEEEITHPTYRREALGHFINDPLAILFNKETMDENSWLYDTLPVGDEYNYVMGLRYEEGVRLALVINAYSKINSKNRCVYETETVCKSYNDLAKEVNKAVVAVGNKKMIKVLDCMGGDNEEKCGVITRNYGVSLQPFDKKKMGSMLMLMSSQFVENTFLLKKGQDFEKELDHLIWNEHRDEIDDSIPSALVRAHASAYIYTYNFKKSDGKKKHDPDDDDEIMDRILQTNLRFRRSA